MLSRLFIALVLAVNLSAPLCHAQTKDEIQTIEKAADDFWESAMNIRGLLPEPMKLLSENTSEYRDNAMIPLNQGLQSATAALAKVSQLALYDQLAMSEDEKKALRTKVKNESRNLRSMGLFIGPTAPLIAMYFLGPGTLTGIFVLPLIWTVAHIFIQQTLPLSSESLETAAKLMLLAPTEKGVDRKLEKIAQKKFKKNWEIFFKRLEAEHGVKLKGLTFNKRFKSFQHWINDTLKLNDLQAAGLIPSACEALLSLPTLNTPLLLTAGPK